MDSRPSPAAGVPNRNPVVSSPAHAAMSAVVPMIGRPWLYLDPLHDRAAHDDRAQQPENKAEAPRDDLVRLTPHDPPWNTTRRTAKIVNAVIPNPTPFGFAGFIRVAFLGVTDLSKP